MSVGLVWKSAAKSNEKLANQKYETMLLSWMPTKIINEKKNNNFWTNLETLTIVRRLYKLDIY